MRSPLGGLSLLRRRLWLAPLAVLPALWAPGVNQGGFRVDTGVYAAIGLHAFRDGSLLPLWAGDQPYFNKPPLAFWIHGALLHLLGPQLWAARLGSLLGAMGCTIATMLAARAFFGRRGALWCGFVLVLTLEFFRSMHAISLDLWLACCVMAGFAAVARPLTGRSSRADWARWIGAGVFWGLALLTKPLVAFAVPALLALWCLAPGRKRLLPWLAFSAAVAAAVAAPWHIWMVRRFGETFTSVYFGKQTLDRAAGGKFADEPWWFYLWLLARTYWPWLLTGALGAAATFRGQLRHSRAKSSGLALLWCGLWLLALTLFGGKSGRYAVIMYPLAAWVSAVWIVGPHIRPLALARRAAERWLALGALVASAGLAVSGVEVHAPEDPQWRGLRERLGSAREDRIWVPPDLLWTTANVYLSEGWWPRTARTEGRPELVNTSDPPESGLMLFRDDGRYLPRIGDDVVWRSGHLMLVRTRSEWDGRVPRNPGDLRADDGE